MQTSDPSNFFRAEYGIAQEQARQAKAERIKDVGAPISVSGKILDLKVKGSEAWMAESGHIIRRLSLETGQTLQIYKGHTAPVTCLVLFEPQYLISGSWDKTIKVWRTSDKSLMSSTIAHTDFLKTLLAIPSLSILVSASSDKTVRIWHMGIEQPLAQLGSIAAHTRPVEALAFEKRTDTSGILYTADSLGSVKAWDLQRLGGDSGDCRLTLMDDWQPHRTGITSLFIGIGLMFSGSSDESIIIDKIPRKSANSNVLHTVSQPAAVKSLLPLFLTLEDENYIIVGVGDSLRVYSYDPSSAGDPPELLREIEAHWHDVTGLAVWVRVPNPNQVELWVLSASLDSTLRRWNLTGKYVVPMRFRQEVEFVEILKPNDTLREQIPPPVKSESQLTEEEERELAELMGE